MGQEIFFPADPTEWELNSIRNDPVKLAQIRRRLSDVSWWMRLLCQYIAMRANKEEGTKVSGGLGHFWQGRYKAVRLLDERRFPQAEEVDVRSKAIFDSIATSVVHDDFAR